jgi:hypothetical protein
MAQIILDSNNNLIQGDFDNATLNNRTKLQTTTTNATTNVYVVPNGSSTSAGVSVANNSNLTNASKIVMATNGNTDTQIISGINGSGTYLPLSFYTNNTLGAQLDTSGNFYATGKMGGVGSVIQVVQSNYSTFTSSSSSTYADTGLSASITPSSSSNKILVFASMVGVGKNTGNCRVALRLVRNSTTIEDFSTETAMSPWNTTTQVDVGTTSCIVLDSPATTSSTTYKVQLASNGNVTQTFVNNVNGSTEVGCTLTLMEIKV